MNCVQDLDIIMGYLGDFGKYQFWQFILHILAALTAGLHMMSLVTVAAVPDHRCLIPEVDFTNISTHNYSIDGLTNFIPTLKNGDLDSCNMYTGVNKTIAPCHSWIYDNTYYKSSRGMEWNFVCNQRWMGAVVQASYMFGVFFGALTLGNAADKYGRKKIFCWCALLQLILGVGVAFVHEYYTVLVVRFLFGIVGSAGSYITGFVLSMELIGPSKRSVCGITFQAAFATGTMFVALWGAVIPNNRQLLQVVYGLHSLVLVGHWWLMDESPRWLWAQGRIDEAIHIVQKALKVNKSPIKLDIADYVLTKSKSVKEADSSVGMMDLFKTPILRNRSLNLCLCWFANALVYYGLALNTGKLQGNPFLILFLITVVEIPCYAITTYLMDRTGRRSLTSSLMITGGVCCIVAAELTRGSIAATCVVILGKFFISGSFAIIYNYSAELFPTVIRNTGLGMGSMCARLSGTLTPLITLLDSFDPTLPSIIFAVIAIISGFLVLFLPETMGAPLPETLEDGETFAVGDTLFTQCCGSKNKQVRTSKYLESGEQMQPLNKIL